MWHIRLEKKQTLVICDIDDQNTKFVCASILAGEFEPISSIALRYSNDLKSALEEWVNTR